MATKDYSDGDLRTLAAKIEANKGEDLDEELRKQLESMSHAQIYNLRGHLSSYKAQNHIGPIEHQAFAREYVGDNPVTGSIGLAAATPLYSLYKAMSSSTGSRSGASLREVSAGYKGIGQGLESAMSRSKVKG